MNKYLVEPRTEITFVNVYAMLMVSFCDTANFCIIYLDNFQQYLYIKQTFCYNRPNPTGNSIKMQRASKYQKDQCP